MNATSNLELYYRLVTSIGPTSVAPVGCADFLSSDTLLQTSVLQALPFHIRCIGGLPEQCTAQCCSREEIEIDGARLLLPPRISTDATLFTLL